MNRDTVFLLFIAFPADYSEKILFNTKNIEGDVLTKLRNDFGGSIVDFICGSVMHIRNKKIIWWKIEKSLRTCPEKNVTLLYSVEFNTKNIIEQAKRYSVDYDHYSGGVHMPIMIVSGNAEMLSFFVMHNQKIIEKAIIFSDGKKQISKWFYHSMAEMFFVEEEEIVQCFVSSSLVSIADNLQKLTGIDFCLRISQIKARPEKYGAKKTEITWKIWVP